MTEEANAGTRTYSFLVGPSALFVAFLIVPFLLPSYYVDTASRIAVIGTFAVAFNIVLGMGGMHSLGHAAFFGSGSYLVALGLTRWGWGLPFIMILVIITGAVLGLVFGVFIRRLSGIYLLLLTLALAQALWGVAFQNVRITGGDMGISLAAAPVPLFGDTTQGIYYFILAVCLIVMIAIAVFIRSPAGIAIQGVRESPSRMASAGYDPGFYKVLAFTVSGIFSAVTGALFAFQQGFVGVSHLDWLMSATVFLAAILGGSRYFLGPLVGAGLLIMLETVLRNYTDRWATVLGVLFIVTIHLMPEGVLGLGRSVGLRKRRAVAQKVRSGSAQSPLRADADEPGTIA